MRAAGLKAFNLLFLSSDPINSYTPLLRLATSTAFASRRSVAMSAASSQAATAASAYEDFNDDSSIHHIWSPLAATEIDPDHPTTLIILNSPISTPPSPLFNYLWQSSQTRICADGGANRLHDADPALLPNLIVGDLDSLRDSVRSYYNSKQQQSQSPTLTTKLQILQDPDQDCNDLDKALQQCNRQSRVVVYGAFGGRFDQEMASMQAMFQWNHKFPNGLWLYNDQTCACLVGRSRRQQGGDNADSGEEIQSKYMIHMKLPSANGNGDSSVPCEGPTCGLIPLAGPCKSITTKGFKWNLTDQSSAFGSLVSTSNHMMSDTVCIESSDRIVFTAEVHSGSTATLW